MVIDSIPGIVVPGSGCREFRDFREMVRSKFRCTDPTLRRRAAAAPMNCCRWRLLQLRWLAPLICWLQRESIPAFVSTTAFASTTAFESTTTFASNPSWMFSIQRSQLVHKYQLILLLDMNDFLTSLWMIVHSFHRSSLYSCLNTIHLRTKNAFLFKHSRRRKAGMTKIVTVSKKGGGESSLLPNCPRLTDIKNWLERVGKMGPAKGKRFILWFRHELGLVENEIVSRVAAGHVNFSPAVKVKVARGDANVAQVNPWA